MIVKRAREGGATILQDIQEESDEFGSARFAILQTVNFQKFKVFIFLNSHNSLSMAILPTR